MQSLIPMVNCSRVLLADLQTYPNGSQDGTVLASLPHMRPKDQYVVWSVGRAHDETEWLAYWGDYFDSYSKALERYNVRRSGSDSSYSAPHKSYRYANGRDGFDG